MTPVVIDSFLRLSQPVNSFVPVPIKKDLGTVRLAIHDRLKILRKASFSVYSFYTSNGRFVLSGYIVDDLCLIQLAAFFLCPVGAVRMLPADRAGGQGNLRLNPCRFKANRIYRFFYLKAHRHIAALCYKALNDDGGRVFSNLCLRGNAANNFFCNGDQAAAFSARLRL